ncbi:MAG: GNAT family N-acetyltransferase [Parcubacteria group bacterium]|nr:GNAT family N-acetyltransferase [Parcubacteria group bacterium]
MMMSNTVSVQQAKNEWSEIAQLHKEYIPKGFLSSLGIKFLERLYKIVLSEPNSFCFVAKSSDEVVGFVCATRSISNIYLKFIFRYWWLGFLMVPKFSWKFVETLFYPARKKNNSDVEILSVVVSKEFQGKGVAESLYQKLFRKLAQFNVDKVSVVVGEDLISSHKFHQRMGGQMSQKFKIHQNEFSYIYIFDVKKYI